MCTLSIHFNNRKQKLVIFNMFQFYTSNVGRVWRHRVGFPYSWRGDVMVRVFLLRRRRAAERQWATRRGSGNIPGVLPRRSRSAGGPEAASTQQETPEPRSAEPARAFEDSQEPPREQPRHRRSASAEEDVRCRGGGKYRCRNPVDLNTPSHVRITPISRNEGRISVIIASVQSEQRRNVSMLAVSSWESPTFIR